MDRGWIAFILTCVDNKNQKDGIQDGAQYMGEWGTNMICDLLFEIDHNCQIDFRLLLTNFIHNFQLLFKILIFKQTHPTVFFKTKRSQF